MRVVHVFSRDGEWLVCNACAKVCFSLSKLFTLTQSLYCLPSVKGELIGKGRKCERLDDESLRRGIQKYSYRHSAFRRICSFVYKAGWRSKLSNNSSKLTAADTKSIMRQLGAETNASYALQQYKGSCFMAFLCFLEILNDLILATQSQTTQHSHSSE